MCVCWHLPHVPGGCGRCWVPCCWRGQRLLHCESQQQPLPSTSRQGLLGVLEAAEAACGRRGGVPDLLAGCIAASVEAAFDASLAQLSANVTAGALGGDGCAERADGGAWVGRNGGSRAQAGQRCVQAACARVACAAGTRSHTPAPAEEDLIMLLAASSAELFKKEAQQVGPAGGALARLVLCAFRPACAAPARRRRRCLPSCACSTRRCWWRRSLARASSRRAPCTRSTAPRCCPG